MVGVVVFGKSVFFIVCSVSKNTFSTRRNAHLKSGRLKHIRRVTSEILLPDLKKLHPTAVVVFAPLVLKLLLL